MSKKASESSDNLSAFIAQWNKELGAKIIDFYPHTIKSKLDLEQITMQIFVTFQNFYAEKEEENQKIKRTLFKLPINSINRKATIFLDSIEDTESKEDKNQPFIVVVLFPDYVSDKELEQYDKLIYNIGTEFINERKPLLRRHFGKIYDSFLLTEKVHDADISIDDNYTFNDALLDFKRGIELFSKKQYEKSFIMLKKADLKFEAEKKVNLLLETSFYLGSTLSQLKKYKAALDYYEKLESLSNQLKHQKYYETSIFMGGFCAFKNEDYDDAIEKFKKLELKSKELQFINKFNFYFLYGRILRISDQNEKSIAILLKALEWSNQLKESSGIKEKRAKLLLELGHTHYNMAIETTKTGKINQKEIKSYLEKAINFYDDCVKLWEELDNYKELIIIYQLTGNIYEVLNKLEQSVESYRKALKYAEITNDVLSRLQIFNLMVQALVKLELHVVIVKEIDEMISKMVSHAYIDLFTIAGFHRQLGHSLFKLDKKKDALSEFLIALNIYNKFETPVRDSLTTLQEIINIYKSLEKEEYIQYYESQYNQLEEEIQELEVEKKKRFEILGEIREIWIINEDGITLLSYCPETKLNPSLFGGFLCALQMFSMELAKEYLNSMTIGLDQYTFYREVDKDVFILGRSSVKTSINLIEASLKSIYNEFFNQFGRFLGDRFDGFIGRFSNFINWIENV